MPLHLEHLDQMLGHFPKSAGWRHKPRILSVTPSAENTFRVEFSRPIGLVEDPPTAGDFQVIGENPSDAILTDPHNVDLVFPGANGEGQSWACNVGNWVVPNTIKGQVGTTVQGAAHILSATLDGSTRIVLLFDRNITLLDDPASGNFDLNGANPTDVFQSGPTTISLDFGGSIFPDDPWSLTSVVRWLSSSGGISTPQAGLVVA